VKVEDIHHAERSYSEDLMLVTDYEIQDTRPAYRDLLYAFHGKSTEMTYEDVAHHLLVAGVEEDDVGDVIEILLWFCFLGACLDGSNEALYAYSVQYNIRRLVYPVETGAGVFTVHSAFHAALELHDGGA
jgi:hypothetical protein